MYMYPILVTSHSIIRWVFLLLLIYTIIIAFCKWFQKKGLKAIDKHISTITVILAHLQLLTGIFLYFISPKVAFGSYTMSNSLLRFFTVEHGFLMLLSITLLTVGNLKVKKAQDPIIASKRLAIWFLIVLILVLAAIPWPFRNFGTNWL